MATSKTKKVPIDKQKERRLALRKAIKQAAYSIDEYGRLNKLAEKIGVTENAILQSIQRVRFSPLMAQALETAVGREHLTREFLCPEKFG